MLRFFCCVLVCFLSFSLFGLDKSSLLKTSELFNQVAEQCLPGVVSISTESSFQSQGLDPLTYFFESYNLDLDRRQKKTGLGSGVLISEDGYILTNLHVVSKVKRISVQLYDGRSFDARVIGVDAKTDLALLKIEGSSFPVIAFGNSDQVQVGDWAIAIGSPFGLQGTMTVGIISAAGRSDVDIMDFRNFIQTDAAINPGNSGGALLNIDGELIGINTAIYSQSGGYMGIGFAIPVNTAFRVVSELKETGVVQRGWLGVYVQAITPALQKQLRLSSADGALISDVFEGSPAEKAGIQRGDIIYKIDQFPIKNFKDLSYKISDTAVNDRVNIHVFRAGESLVLPVQIVVNPHQAVSSRSTLEQRPFGLEIQQDHMGFVVKSVASQGPAYRAGLREGDLLLQLNQKDIRSVSRFYDVLDRSKQVLLLVQRGRYVEYVVLSR